jgi:transcriptional regulator with XRE-family HTH domain
MTSTTPGRNPLTVRGRRVVRELRRLRREREWTLDEAAEHSGLSAATISRTENGESLRPVNVTALLAAYGVTGELLRQLTALARQARRKGWWSGIDESVMSWPYKDLAELEQEATWKHSYEPLIVPGLLQTPEYADAILEVIYRGLPEENLSEYVAVRMKRQEQIRELTFSVLLLEEVLRAPLGKKGVMKGQLERLLEESLSDRVDIRVIPHLTGSCFRVIGNFSFLGGFSPLDAVVAFVEAQPGIMVYEDDETILRLRQQYEALLAQSLDLPQSRRLIERIRKETPGDT